MSFSEHQQNLRKTIQEGESEQMRAAKFAETMAARVGPPSPRYPVEDHQNERIRPVEEQPSAAPPLPVFIDPRMKPFFESLVEMGKVAEAALKWIDQCLSSAA
jgi:hypothetical protein